MSTDFIKACLNLYAVLKNLEELVHHDAEAAKMAKDWRIVIQFFVRKGPCAFIGFKNGRCSVFRGYHSKPDVKLWFQSPAHLNRMIHGDSNPFPLKGFRQLGFLTKKFTKLTDKLERYLKPKETDLKDPSFLALNTRMIFYTAAFAVRELAFHDPVGKLLHATMLNGTIAMEIVPDGPAVQIRFDNGSIVISKSRPDSPMALMQFDGIEIANKFLNGKLDASSAISNGRVRIRGHIPMLETMGTILDRMPQYL
ncbi:MAG: SCP2 sterol-binding domain-containing protein [Desulfobacteraceae bacterium]|nr:SCP2 sterol-binding domain-containing protein [Desulfobacteraceae bacterium]